MLFQSYSKLQLNPNTQFAIIGFGFNSTCKRGMEKYLESMSAFFGREEGEIHLSGKINLHTSPSLVGSGKEGKEETWGKY